ncbi:hypothetical protein ACFC6L_33680, partial [Kitasatospora phosalacinea]|uniref:hypothetical protein n=1 Tax=Kitasatospora phosalacinea TaxID=2065 RepID=UPI0035D60E21
MTRPGAPRCSGLSKPKRQPASSGTRAGCGRLPVMKVTLRPGDGLDKRRMREEAAAHVADL